ncbi:hypothetical protein KHO57_gp108 [Mycobacterium phage Phabba]|uniref:Uncharacterized protein n=1 Tax=Mycobacterium phage Phabba TaxID=2027899 RepID=A0A249XSW7_9CAUD|nr:hypothetical protein KHO57_gp108 [Mycobacterium phage Phabba]ASZ74796.1 hypothetical protein SEA_PHABBA_259 [Mycobacterium phage Phabba]
MTKKIGPEQHEHLKALSTAKNKLQRVREREDEAMREVHDKIREGFRMDISGIKLAKASGLSLPRVYQVRDEMQRDDEEAQARLDRNPETKEALVAAEADIDNAVEVQV